MANAKRRIGGCAALIAIAGAAGAWAPASAQTVVPSYNAISPETLRDVVNAQGKNQITIDTSDPQGPVVKVQTVAGLAYSVFMDDCDNGKPNLCKSLEFRASLPAGALNFFQINAFNEKMRYATAYLTDKGVPQLRMDANLRGGVTSNFVAYSVQIFVKVVLGYIQETK